MSWFQQTVIRSTDLFTRSGREKNQKLESKQWGNDKFYGSTHQMKSQSFQSAENVCPLQKCNHRKCQEMVIECSDLDRVPLRMWRCVPLSSNGLFLSDIPRESPKLLKSAAIDMWCKYQMTDFTAYQNSAFGLLYRNVGVLVLHYPQLFNFRGWISFVKQ